MKLLILVFTFTFFTGCIVDNIDGSSKNPPVGQTPDDGAQESKDICLKSYFDKTEIESIAKLAEASYQATKVCAVSIQAVVKEVERLRGVSL